MPDQTQTEGSEAAVTVPSGKMTFAEALAKEPAGDSSSASAAQSKTTDGVGKEGVDDDDLAGDQEDDQQGSDTDDSDGPDGQDEGGEDEEESNEDETGQETDDEVELPEPIAKIVSKLEESDPSQAKEVRAYIADQEKLIDEADRTIQANAGVLGIFEALTNAETHGDAFTASLEMVAKELGVSVPEMLLKQGYVQAPTGDVSTPEFLAEDRRSSLIEEVLKPAEFVEGAGLEDAKQGAEMMLAYLIAKVPEMLPADYHGGYQEWQRQQQQMKEQTEAQAEAAKVAKVHYVKVASKIARNYEGFKVTEDQVREASVKFPLLPKSEDEVYFAVVKEFEPRLTRHLRGTTVKRQKKRMPETPGKAGDNKPQARKPFRPGIDDMKFEDAVPR